jgi:hypothetical protein
MLLLALKKKNSAIAELEGIPKKVFNFYALLLIEAGFVLGSVHESTSKDTPAENYILVQSLTKRGLEFAGLIEDDALWEKAKSKILNHKGCTLEILKNYLNQEKSVNLKK